MGLFKSVYGSTPIDDHSDLIPSHILTFDELNEWESANILKAAIKYLTKRHPAKLTIEWLRRVHRDMFDETWRWAGQLRKRNLNIGADWHNLLEQLKLLIDDITYWQNHAKEMSLLSQSVRLHHRLVKIHPFINGNGRHARLVSDIYLYNFAQPMPIWPNDRLIKETDIRKQYISALQAADRNNYARLEEFTKALIHKENR